MLREIRPHIGGIRAPGNKLKSSYDLVVRMDYLYVQVVKAKDLPISNLTGTCDPFIEIKVGTYKALTRNLKETPNLEWNQVFAFLKDTILSANIEVTVKDYNLLQEDFIGRVSFDLNQVCERVPPDSPLVPQWYKLSNMKWDLVKGEIMLAVWIGTQADEAFSGAWCSDAAAVDYDDFEKVRSKVYPSPKLWYLRVNVIQAQDLRPTDENRVPESFGKVVFGNQALSTKDDKTLNPHWNEDLMFVAAEPSEEPVVLSVEDRVAPDKVEVLGRCVIPLHMVDRRSDHKPLLSRWYRLTKYVPAEGGKKKDVRYAGRIHVRICLEGGYHVIDESANSSSDLRPTAKQLWKSSIGVLDLGILSAYQLSPMRRKDRRGTIDAYCVAKYAHKWVRTRTITDSLSPRWNEQYSWEVYDPFTVITIGVFDNSRLQEGEESVRAEDSRIGKIRIRLSTLETGRVYTHSYPLLVLQPSGVKKMGELQLAVRFARSSLLNLMNLYSQPLLPKMHHIRPLTAIQLETLRREANQIVCMRLSCAEPPLRKEVVEYLLDVHSHQWSNRRSKVNFDRVMEVLGTLIALGSWLDEICNWKKPGDTLLIHILLVAFVTHPELICPVIFIYLSLIGWRQYVRRPRHPVYVDTLLSRADDPDPDELEEEFDTFPSSCPTDILRKRYDRLRTLAGRVQSIVGDVATQGEKLQSLLSWRDQRATFLFLIFCHVAAILLYLIPFDYVVLLSGFYVMRPPRFRYKLPAVPVNFFRRLPARTDSLL